MPAHKKVRLSASILGLVNVLAWFGLSTVSYPAVDAVVLGRYSMAFALVLGFSGLLTMFWGLVVWQYALIDRWVQRIPLSVWIVCLISLSLIGGGIAWLPVQSNFKQFIALSAFSWGVFALLLRPIHSPRLWRVVLIFVVFWAILTLSHSLLSPFRGVWHDEALWADVATLWARGHSVVQYQPSVMPPIANLSVVGYGVLLELFGYTPYVGRALQAVVLLFALWFTYQTGKLLGKFPVGILSVVLLLLSQNLLAFYDYRPHNQLVFVASGLLWAMSTYHHTAKKRALFGVGLFATLGIQAHSAGIVFAVGTTLYYALAGLALWNQTRSFRQAIRAILPFIAGAGLGTFVFIAINLPLAGGLEAFLSYVSDYRTSAPANVSFLPLFLTAPYGIYWVTDSILLALAWIGGGFSLFAGQSLARKVFFMAGLWMLVAIRLDPFGYPHVHLVSLALLGAYAIRRLFGASIARLGTVGAVLCLILALQHAPTIRWQTFFDLANGTYEPFYAPFMALATRLEEDYLVPQDVVLTTEQLFWAWSKRPDWYGISAETMYTLRNQTRLSREYWQEIGISAVVYMEDDAFLLRSSLGLVGGMWGLIQAEGFIPCEAFQLGQYTVSVYLSPGHPRGCP